MKYKLIGNNNSFNVLETILKNRGIDDSREFIDAGTDPKSEHHYSKLKNIEKAVGVITSYIDSNKEHKVFVQPDNDIDGQLSSAMIIKYLDMVAPHLNITWKQHDKEQHTVDLSYVEDDVELVIIPDAGSNDIEKHKILHEKGMDVVVIDHHEIERKSEHAIIVNNQDGNYPNQHLSGSGVVYKVLQALDDELGYSLASGFSDMAAIGIVADMMPLTSLENRLLVTQGLNSINNPLLESLYKAQSKSTKGLATPTTTSFYISPLFNAVIRCGTQEEKEQILRALLSDGGDSVYNEEEEIHEDLIENTIEMMREVRERQNEIVEEGVSQIKDKIEKENLLDKKILIADVTGILSRRFTGLVANKLLSEKEIRRPVLLLKENKETNTLDGSARGYEKGYIKDLRNFLNETGYFEYNSGHANAFGSSIKKDRLRDFQNEIEKKYVDIDFGSNVYEVDFVLNGEDLKSHLIKEIYYNQFLWGKDIEEPLLALENVKVEKRRIDYIGKDKNHMKFSFHGTEYIKFFIEDEEKEEIESAGETDILNFSIVGRAGINEWQGIKTDQIIVEDYMINSIEEDEFIF